MSYNEDMAMEDALYPWLASDCMSHEEFMECLTEIAREEGEDFEDDFEDDGQPDEMQEWHDFDPDC